MISQSIIEKKTTHENITGTILAERMKKAIDSVIVHEPQGQRTFRVIFTIEEIAKPSKKLENIDIVFFYYEYSELGHKTRIMSTDYLFSNQATEEEIFKFLEEKHPLASDIIINTIER